jgi:hypothetical protein
VLNRRTERQVMIEWERYPELENGVHASCNWGSSQ